jgi:hypothetical protein
VVRASMTNGDRRGPSTQSRTALRSLTVRTVTASQP